MSDIVHASNRVLGAMAPDDLRALALHLRPVSLSKGEVLIAQGASVDFVHFPTSAVLGNALILGDGSAVETATIGSESVSGLAAFLAGAPIAWEVTVQAPGHAWVLGADRLRRRVEESRALLQLLLRVTYDAQRQAAQTAACNAEHDADERLAKWLLLIADRTGDAVISLTQQEVAALLGAERTTINSALGRLRDAGGVKLRRGGVEIIDRPALEAVACECYAAQRMWSGRLGLSQA